MATFVDRLLDLADQMIGMHPNSSAVKRRAVSTAYYAAFHALAKICAGALLSDASSETDAYARIYRALDHGSLKDAFQPKDSPLQQHAALKRVGDLIVPLQSARMLADYAVPKIGFYDLSEAQNHVVGAREIAKHLDTLSIADRQVLAVHLLFRVRKK